MLGQSDDKGDDEGSETKGPSQRDPGISFQGESSAPAATSNGGGPRSDAGKAKVAKNAITHAITSLNPVAGRETEEEWRAFLLGMFESLSPIGTLEIEIVQNMAIDLWRRRRITRAEVGYIATQFEAIEEPSWPPREESAPPLAIFDGLLQDRGVDVGTASAFLDALEILKDEHLENEETVLAWRWAWLILRLCPANSADSAVVAKIMPTEYGAQALRSCLMSWRRSMVSLMPNSFARRKDSCRTSVTAGC
jgi:hypothetical protein